MTTDQVNFDELPPQVQQQLGEWYRARAAAATDPAGDVSAETSQPQRPSTDTKRVASAKSPGQVRVARHDRYATTRLKRRKLSVEEIEALPLYDRIFPAWGQNIGNWLVTRPDYRWKIVGVFLVLLVLLPLGFVAIYGNGLASVQGVRLVGAEVGLTTLPLGDPSIWWAILPFSMLMIQIFVRVIPFARSVWHVSLLIDGSTTALFIAWQFYNVVVNHGREPNFILIGIEAAILGLAVAVLAEKLFLAAIAVAWTLYQGEPRQIPWYEPVRATMPA